MKEKIPIIINGKEFNEIIITDDDRNVIAMITNDGDIIEHDGYKIVCVPF